MKKLLSLLLLLIPLFVMGNSSYQDEDYGLVYVDPVTMGLSADSTKHLAGGTLIGSITSMDVFIACPDDFYSWGGLGQDIFYYPYYYFNGRGVSVENGIFGQTNPKDKNNKSPSNSLTVPETGCAFSMKANKDGYMYVWGVFSTAKAYSLFEDSIAVGYRIAMITNGWHREGYNSILDHDRVYLQYGEWHKPLTRRTPDISYIITGDSLNQVNVYGEGVMVFPVRAGSTYIMLGSGCKFMFGGVHFSEEMESTIQLGDASAPTFTLLSKNDTPEFYEEAASPEPYAVLSDNNTKLTFFYDDQKDARGGMSVGPFDLNNYPSWYNQRESITTAEFDDSFANCTTLTSTAFWFYDCGKITSIIGMNNLKTDNVTDMGWMFSGCSGLTSLSVSGFNTANVTYMGYMFYGCSGLTSLDVSNFNTANVEDMLNMFYGCSSLTTLDVSRFNTANVTLMGGMFQDCSALTAIDVSNFNTDKVTVMTSMFADCSSLTSLDVANFNTTNVTRMGSMFGHCSSVTSLDVSRFNTANVTDMGQMFSNCSSLTSLDVSGFKTDNVTEMRYMFAGCSGLTSLNVSGFNTANVTNMVGMFSGCSALTSLDVSGFNTDNVTSMNSMFENCSGLNAIDISNFNTANVKYMDGVFRGCSGLTSLDVSRFNTENVTAMRYMFYGCSSLTSLDVTNFKTDHVTSMQWMFRDCSGLTSLDVSHFNTENVVNMSYMFANCSHITSLDVSNFNTSKVTDMSSMFYGCSGLTSLNVSNFNTSNATTMTYMFGNCSHITTLDLSNFNTSKVTDMNFMFKDCSALTTIFVGSEWVTSSPSATVDMFEGCTSLVGGAGTVYDANHIDHNYAHIDGGSSNPGYFTAKNAPEGEATFDGKVARVSGERTLDEAFEQRGGRAEATRTIAAIIWNKESALTESDLQGITNPNLLVYVNDASLAPSNVQNVVINGMAREIVLTDVTDGNNDWYAPQAFVAERISYTRNFGQSTTKGTSRGWESIALPFDVQSIQHETKGVIAPFNSSASNKHFWLRRLTDNGLQAATNIEANTPYIISMPNSEEYVADYNLNGRVTFSAQNIDVPATKAKVLALADSSIVMVPAMQRQSRSSSVWALNVGEVRGQYFEGSVFERDYRTVRPFEAYTIHRQENGQPAPRYVPIQEIAGVTGIETIDREPLTLNQWYDMQGRKLEGKPARKGVYISNGKKVVVK